MELDGSGNGKGIVKVSMFNNAKFGVEFKGIKVAKGGCVVAGQAILSNVDVALLSEEQRKKLAETYAAFNKILDIVDKAAEGIAETYNSLADLYKGIAKKTQNILDKVNKGEKITKKEQDDLGKLKAKANENMSQATDLVIKKWGSSGSEPFIAFVKSANESCACSAETETAKPKKGPSAYEENIYFYGDNCKKCLEEQKEKQAKLALVAKKMEEIITDDITCGCFSFGNFLADFGTSDGSCGALIQILTKIKTDFHSNYSKPFLVNENFVGKTTEGQVMIGDICIDQLSLTVFKNSSSSTNKKHSVKDGSIFYRDLGAIAIYDKEKAYDKLKALDSWLFGNLKKENSKGELLTEKDYEEISSKLGVEICVIKAIAKVEVGGKSGFLKDGITPKIRYEGHYMRKFLKKDTKYKDKIDDFIKNGYDDVIYSYENRGKYDHDLKMLIKAKEIDEGYAEQSSSWGVGQIMGANFEQAGHSSIGNFVEAQNSLEGQVKTFIAFCAGDSRLLKAMKEKDFETVAKIYNGKYFKDNKYDTKMQTAYNECK